jgi:hypothetical protein
MTFAPPTLLALQDYLEQQTRLSAANLGIVGDARHQSGYHLGRDRIYSITGRRDQDYSVQTSRDRSGLTDAASAMDIGSFPRLRELSIFLVRRCRDGVPDTRDIREVIYSPDGRTVLRWDRQRGVNSAPQTGEADASHLWHTHISWYRDSASRDQRGPFRAYFGGSNDMGLPVTILDPTYRGTYRTDDRPAAGIDLATGLPVTIPAGSTRHVHFTARRTDPDGSGYVLGNASGKPIFVGLSQPGTFTADADGAPADVAAAIAARDEEWRTFLLAGSPGEP